MRIGVDIDGVMYKWIKTAHYMLREVMPDSPYKGNTELLHGDEKQVTHFDWTRGIVGEEHWHWLFTEGVRLGLFRYGHLYPGTIVAMRELAKIGEVIIITHRPKNAVNDTLAWLSYLDLPIAGVHILTDGQPKSSVKPDCEIYIDDKPENVYDLASNTKAKIVAMPNRPWNQSMVFPVRYLSAAFRRTYTWDDFINLAKVTI